MNSKSDIRSIIKKDRKKLDIKAISRELSNCVISHPAFCRAKNVMLYYPTALEIDLLEIMRENKNFYFPKVDGDNLLVCPGCGNFKKSDLNIFEPCSAPVNAEILDLIIVPALAVDKDNYRLGYGGGFYDRFLAKYPNIETLTAIPHNYVFAWLPREKNDIPVDFVVTDK